MAEARPYMADAAADALIADGLDRLFEVEHDLPSGVNEANRTAHFAAHLKYALDARPDVATGGWSIDPEYNRLGEKDPKLIPTFRGQLASLAQELGWPVEAFVGSATGKLIPDVIVHRRKSGRGNGNLIVCELKRLDASKQAIAADLVKLAVYREYIGYEHAFLILLGDTRDACVVHRASTSLEEIAWYVQHLDEAAAIRRWKQGHARSAQRQRSSSQLQEPSRPWPSPSRCRH
jgi:hypothetical protein